MYHSFIAVLVLFFWAKPNVRKTNMLRMLMLWCN